MEDNVDELLQFLGPDARQDLKKLAVDNILGLTAASAGHIFFCQHEKLLEALIQLTGDNEKSIRSDAFLALVNLSADDVLAEKLVALLDSSLIRSLLDVVAQTTKSENVEAACKILNNLTRQVHCSHKVYEIMQEMKCDFRRLVAKFGNEASKHDYHYLAGFFCNITQIPEMRTYVLKKDETLLKDLLPYVLYKASDVRREGVAGMIRNCCFDTELHDLLLNDDHLDLLVYLALPLAGPEEYDDEEMSSLPLELQYLGDDQKRDSNPGVRKMVLEALTQLCASRKGRQFVRDKNIYLILREHHKWEKVPSVQNACENLVQLLIGDEYEEVDNLKKLDIPNDLVVKFEEMDAKEQLEDLESVKVEDEGTLTASDQGSLK